MKNNLTDLIKHNSIRVLIVLILTVEILFFALVTGYLAYTGGLRTVTENAGKTSSLVHAEIAKTLVNYLEEPQQLEQFHKTVIMNQQLDFANQAQRDKYFVEALKIFPGVANTYIGLANGREYGARREDDGSFAVWEAKAEQGRLNYYRYDCRAGRQEYLRSISPYDTRNRPPYKRGIELGKPGWTEVYPSATGRGLVVTAVHPLYDSQNELVGVLGSSLLLDWMDEFLRSFSVTEHSSIYIISRDGKIIAAANEAVNRAAKTDEPNRKDERKSPLLSQALKSLEDSKQSIDPIQTDTSLTFRFNDEKYIAQVRPIHGKNSLDWVSVMIVPESDLTQGMNDFSRQLLFITLAACLLGLGTGVVSARYIVNPIIEVNRQAKAIADGDFSSRLSIDRPDEIGQLVHTVNEMSQRLSQYFEKLREEKLRTKLLTAGLETSSNLVLILDENRLVWWVNPAFEELLGYTLAEIKGQRIRSLLPEQNDPQVILQLQECLTRQREWRGEIIARSKDGRHYVDEIWLTPILDEAGKPSYYLAIGQDITGKVKARETMVEAQNAKAKAEKLYSIGTMASGLSHEINQPLNSIKVIAGGLLYMLRQGSELPREEYEESLGEIHGQADRIADIIKHLRSYIRDEQRRLVPCDLNFAMEGVLRLLALQIEVNGVKVIKEFLPNLPKVLANPIGLEQIGVNLLTNAVEALGRSFAEEKRITLRTRFDKQVILEIGNNGPRIEAEFRESIFEPFVSSKASGENQGLGLAIVRSIVDAFNGSIELAQSGDEGVLFRISLPAANKESVGIS